ncbi:MAG: murein biosynthesis integral membrane protein MurJ [Actinomycetota bacterium]
MEEEGTTSPSLARSTAVMTAGTVLSRVTGVVRLTAMAATLGIAESRLPDTYNLANTVPNIIYELVLGGVVTSIFVPLFVELLEKEKRERAWEVISAILTISLIGLSVIAVIGIIAAPAIAGFYAGRLEGGDQALQRDAITFLLRLFLPQVVLYGIYFVGAGIMNAHKRFGPPMWTPIVNNLVLIAVLVYFHQAYGAVTLQTITQNQLLVIGLGTTASVAPMGLLLFPYLKRLGRLRLTTKLRHPAVKKLARLAVFVIGFVIANQAGYIVIQWLANRQQGGYSAYIAAFTFYIMPMGLFVLSITTALVPSLSQHATNERWDDFREQLSVGIRSTIFLMVPAAVGYLLLGELIVIVLLEHGLATATSTALVTDILGLFVLGLVQFAIFQLLVRSFYAMQDTKTPFWVNCVVVVVNIALAVPLFAAFEVRGIAGAQAVANTVGVVVLGVAMWRRLGGIDGVRIAGSIVRITVATSAMAAVVTGGLYATSSFSLEESFLVQVAVLTTLVVFGAAAYLLAARAVNVPELAFVRSIVTRRRKET